MMTPAEAAYEAWKTKVQHLPFEKIGDWREHIWQAVADAVIAQSKTIIAEEMAKALKNLTMPKLESVPGDVKFCEGTPNKAVMDALMWYAKKRHLSELVIDDGKRAAKALRAVITQQPASTPQT